MKKKVCAAIVLLLICNLIMACGPSADGSAEAEKETGEISGFSVSEAEEGQEKAESEESVKEEPAVESMDSSSEPEEETIEVGSDYQITRDIYGVVSDKVLDWEYNRSDIKIDESGNVTSEHLTGSGNHTMNYEYNSDARMTRALKETSLYGTEEMICTYDENGVLIKLDNIKTESSGTVIENITEYVYDESGSFMSSRHISGNGKTYESIFENDEDGRILKVTQTEDGEPYDVMTFSYDEGVYNPTHISTERKKKDRGYEEDLTYDDRGRMVRDYILYESGTETAFEYTYDVVGQITESPETNSDLLPGGEWEFFDDCPLLPKPDSCVASILAGEDENRFSLPTYRG